MLIEFKYVCTGATYVVLMANVNLRVQRKYKINRYGRLVITPALEETVDQIPAQTGYFKRVLW